MPHPQKQRSDKARRSRRFQQSLRELQGNQRMANERQERSLDIRKISRKKLISTRKTLKKRLKRYDHPESSTKDEMETWLIKRIKEIDKEIKRRARKKVEVTEHALIRYCERVLGVDFDEIREEILFEGLEERVNFASSGRFEAPDKEFTAIVEKGTIVSVVTTEMEPR